MNEEIYDHLLAFGPKPENDIRQIFGMTREQIAPHLRHLVAVGLAFQTMDGLWHACKIGEYGKPIKTVDLVSAEPVLEPWDSTSETV